MYDPHQVVTSYMEPGRLSTLVEMSIIAEWSLAAGWAPLLCSPPNAPCPVPHLPSQAAPSRPHPPTCQSYYLGYLIPSNHKMEYKG